MQSKIHNFSFFSTYIHGQNCIMSCLVYVHIWPVESHLMRKE